MDAGKGDKVASSSAILSAPKHKNLLDFPLERSQQGGGRLPPPVCRVAPQLVPSQTRMDTGKGDKVTSYLYPYTREKLEKSGITKYMRTHIGWELANLSTYPPLKPGVALRGDKLNFSPDDTVFQLGQRHA
jgi:hypothetical protein